MKLLVPLMMPAIHSIRFAVKSFAQRLDDRNAACDRRLECEHHAVRACGVEQLVTVPREQRLIGGDDVLAARDRIERKRVRGLVTAHQLDNDVDVRVTNHVVEVRRDRHFGADDRAGLVDVAHRDGRDLDAAPGPPRNFVLIALQDFVRTAADGAKAQQPNLDG